MQAKNMGQKIVAWPSVDIVRRTAPRMTIPSKDVIEECVVHLNKH